MTIIIKDGTGSGVSAKVNSDNQLSVRAIVQTEQEHATQEDRSFTVGSGLVNLTSPNASAVLYFKNTGDKDLVITQANVYSSKQASSTAGTFKLVLYRGATGLSGGTSVEALSTTFGSTSVLTADVTAGAEAATVTGGTATGAYIFPEAIFHELSLAWTVPKGQSISAVVIPGASNSGMEVGVTIEVFEQDSALED